MSESWADPEAPLLTGDADYGDGQLPRHQDEIMGSHLGQPTEEQAVKMGVTAASGGDSWGSQ